MRFDILTIFPGFFSGFLENGILRRALAENLLQIETHDLRNFTHDRHRTVDGRPFGGGEGMVLKPQPLADALASLGVQPKSQRAQAQLAPAQVVLLSAQGRPFTQAVARHLATLPRVVFICGRYEGVDERINDLYCDLELSIGDYVLSGGELAAAIPTEGGFYIWVRRGLGPFWGYQESWLSLTANYGCVRPIAGSMPRVWLCCMPVTSNCTTRWCARTR